MKSKTNHGPEWFLSPEADKAIDAVIEGDHRRSWDPRRDTPSLASLGGKAKDYADLYARSRGKLLAKAGVRTRTHRAKRTGAVAFIVTLPSEALSSAIKIDRETREIVGTR